MDSSKQFLDLFLFESVRHPNKQNENTVFQNCTILRSFGKFKLGDKVDAIGVQLSLFLWTSETDFEEETIIL